jgi:FtsZ-interacting cell division protein ZipA
MCSPDYLPEPASQSGFPVAVCGQKETVTYIEGGAMELWAVILLVVVAVAVVALVVVMQKRRESAKLRDRFGPEYQRTLDRADGRAEAEKELKQRAERREKLDIRSLSPEDRERYAERWRDTQAHFVDNPRSAVHEADALVILVMRERGYPIDDFDRRAADVSVDHPRVVENYRSAHAISVADKENKASTEDLRQAMVHYRALFEDLLEQPSEHAAGRPGTAR